MTAFDSSAFTVWMEGVASAKLPERRWVDNEITRSAMATRPGGTPSVFLQCLQERIARVCERLPGESTKKLVDKLATLGTKDWIGSYAELAAMDFFLSLPFGLSIEVDPPGPQLGLNPAPLDGVVPSLALHYDVKALTDTNRRALANLHKEIAREFPGVHLAFHHQNDLSQTAVQAEFSELRAAIKAAVHAKSIFIDYQAIGLRVTIYYERPSYFASEHSYSPYRQAERQKTIAISDAHQLLCDDRNLRVLVIHPFYNQTNADPFGGAHDVFFRSLARRAFCELTKSTEPLQEFLNSKKTLRPDLTVADAATRLTGILFLVDNSIGSRVPRDAAKPHSVIDAFLFENPNAIDRSKADLNFHRLGVDGLAFMRLIEDFEHDNY